MYCAICATHKYKSVFIFLYRHCVDPNAFKAETKKMDSPGTTPNQITIRNTNPFEYKKKKQREA